MEGIPLSIHYVNSTGAAESGFTVRFDRKTMQPLHNKNVKQISIKRMSFTGYSITDDSVRLLIRPIDNNNSWLQPVSNLTSQNLLVIPENPDATYPYNWPDLNLPVLRIEKEIEGGAPFFISGFDFELRDESNAHVNFSDFYCIIILS